MDWDTAEQTYAAISELRKCPGFTDLLLPEIQRRRDALTATAMTPGKGKKVDRRAARERHNELTELLDFLTSAEANATTRLRKDPAEEP